MAKARRKSKPAIKKEKKQQKLDFETLVVIGILFLSVGLVLSSAAAGALGAIIFVIGLAGYLSKCNMKFNMNNKKRK